MWGRSQHLGNSQNSRVSTHLYYGHIVLLFCLSCHGHRKSVFQRSPGPVEFIGGERAWLVAAKSDLFSHFIFYLILSLISDQPFGGTAPRGPVRHVGVWGPGSPVQQSVAGASSLAKLTASTWGAANPWLTDIVCGQNQRPGGTVWGLPVIVCTPPRYHQLPRSLVKTQTLICLPPPTSHRRNGVQAAALIVEAAPPHFS